jgi:trimethylamine--corrinoid protein Co-methyltransferase
LAGIRAEASLAFDAHHNVGHGGHFFGTAHTLENFRTCFYRPFIASTENFERCVKRGSKDTAQRAAEQWPSALERYDRLALDTAIDTAIE